MKVKPIINDSNFSKVQAKQPLFIVRPKPSQTKLQVPSHSRQLSSPTSSSSTHKAIDQCIRCLDLQISEELPIPKAFCLRIREHLLTLKLKFNPQQSYYQNRQQGDPLQTLLRKQSSKFFRGQRTEGYEESRNKENLLLTENFSTVKMLKGRSAREEYQLQIQTLKGKIKLMSDRIDEYQRDYHEYGNQLKKVETLLDKEIKEKVEVKEEFMKEQKKRSDLECQLQKALSQFEEKCRLMEHQKKAICWCLSERENQIITLYQLLSK